MHSHLLVSPVEARFPGDEDGMFHLLECVFDLVLSSIGSDDLLVGPVVVVGKINSLPELSAVKPGHGSGVGAKAQHNVVILLVNLYVEQLGVVLP